MDHRPLEGVTRPINLLGLKLAAAWVLIIALSFLAAHWLGTWVVALFGFGGLLAVAAIHSRYATRHLIWTTLTTDCPQCGTGPLPYKSSPSNAGHGLLACEKCQIEWDLGRGMGSPGNAYSPKSLIGNISNIIDKQIENNDPPETRQTLERLLKEGHTSADARDLMSTAAIVETFHIISDRKPFNRERYIWNLARMPGKPWDAQGKELYKPSPR